MVRTNNQVIVSILCDSLMKKKKKNKKKKDGSIGFSFVERFHFMG